jgi:exonuclease VII small subunit
MDLVQIGSTDIKPRTLFFWDIDEQATVETTEIAEDRYLVRASKSYRLVKQDERGQESWDRNLSQMNKELASTFSSFSLQVDYCDTTSVHVLDEHGEASELVAEAHRLQEKAQALNERKESASVALQNSLPSLENTMQQRHEEAAQELRQVEGRLDTILETLEDKKQVVNQWKADGVSLAYLFQFSTDPEIIPGDRLEEAAERHVEEAFDLHRRKVKQVLQGPKFKLHVEELEEPRVFNRVEHTGLLNPDGFTQILEQVDDEEVESSLKDLRQDSAQQYMAVALRDIEVGDRTVEREKATPSRAVNSVLQNLKAETVAYAEDVPNTGPMIGTLTGTNQVVGFDPAELPHYYITGETGSGKSYLKRVLLENIASLGYDVLSISPSDREEIGLSLPNPEREDGVRISVDQYWIGDNQLLDKPGDVTELFSGVNAATLKGLSDSDKQEFVNQVFTALAEIDRRDTPLFVFLEEAHNFTKGAAADAIQDLVREARKFGVHVVIVSQSPMDFNRNHKHVRENTVSVFMHGEYFDYASKFLNNGNEIQDLATGEAILQSREYPKLRVDVREAFTLPTAPSIDDIQRIQERFQATEPDLRPQEGDTVETAEETTGTELSEDEEALLDFIQGYIEENDERPSKSKCYREDNAPFGSSKTQRILDQLLQKDLVQEDTVERYGNESQVFSPV